MLAAAPMRSTTAHLTVFPAHRTYYLCSKPLNHDLCRASLAELLAAFLRVPSHEIDFEIEKWLQRVVLELGLDRSAVGQVDPTDGTLIATHQWSRESVPPIPHRL